MKKYYYKLLYLYLILSSGCEPTKGGGDPDDDNKIITNNNLKTESPLDKVIIAKYKEDGPAIIEGLSAVEKKISKNKNKKLIEDFEKIKKNIANNINTSDSKGYTALFYSTVLGSPKFMEALLKNGADPNQSNNNQVLPIHYAVYEQNLDMVSLLIKYNTKINPKEKEGNIPLHATNDKQIAQLLIKNSSKNIVTEKNNDGNNPLMETFEVFREDVNQDLVEYYLGIREFLNNINDKNKKGQTLLDIVIYIEKNSSSDQKFKEKFEKIKKVLMEKGAKTSI